MNQGDKFIRYSKHGAVIGIVEKVTTSFQYDIRNRVKIEKKKILSTKGIVYDYEECYLIIKKLDFGFCFRLNALISKFKKK